MQVQNIQKNLIQNVTSKNSFIKELVNEMNHPTTNNIKKLNNLKDIVNDTFATVKKNEPKTGMFTKITNFGKKVLKTIVKYAKATGKFIKEKAIAVKNKVAGFFTKSKSKATPNTTKTAETVAPKIEKTAAEIVK